MMGAWFFAPFSRLQRRPQSGHSVLWCAGARFAGSSLPPRARGTMWSRTSDPGCPQMWQVSLMRSRASRRACIRLTERVEPGRFAIGVPLWGRMCSGVVPVG